MTVIFHTFCKAVRQAMMKFSYQRLFMKKIPGFLFCMHLEMTNKQTTPNKYELDSVAEPSLIAARYVFKFVND